MKIKVAGTRVCLYKIMEIEKILTQRFSRNYKHSKNVDDFNRWCLEIYNLLKNENSTYRIPNHRNTFKKFVRCVLKLLCKSSYFMRM